MEEHRRLLLTFHSNIASFEVTVYTNGIIRKIFNTGSGCICICNPSPCLRLVARPLTDGYSTSLYYWITPNCGNIKNLYFSFPANPALPVGVNFFTLTDSVYGLPIDGELSFTQT